VSEIAAVAIVLSLVITLAWLARRGSLAMKAGRGNMAVETAIGLGERRSLVIVAVEGRRLLLGLTPAQVSFVAELNPTPPPGERMS
jgi:flagellar protein FliO/FliZ